VGSAYQSVAISPQGTHLAYAADARIYVRALDTSDARALAGTEDQTVGGMMFSPDGQWLAFNRDAYGELRRVPILGGASLKIATVDVFSAEAGVRITGSYSRNSTVSTRWPPRAESPCGSSMSIRNEANGRRIRSSCPMVASCSRS
jgi:Tol biopolymer transport system component